MENTERNSPGQELKKRKLSKTAYFLGLAVIFTAVFSQYFFPLRRLDRSFIVIYGVPAVFITVVSGFDIIKRTFRNNFSAVKYGLASWGVLLSISYILDVVILNLLAAFIPNALSPLYHRTPFAHLGSSPWAMIALSFFIIGPAEEYIFRGFVFGGALRAFPRFRWTTVMIFATTVFTLMHFYYILIFGPASIVILPDIFAIGLALSAAYYYSGGNLLIPIILHGLFDSFGFLSLATGSDLGYNLRFFMIGAGLLVAIYLTGKNSFLPGCPPTSALEA
jgi:membrane protease YdiL (CAAX protease family)